MLTNKVKILVYSAVVGVVTYYVGKKLLSNKKDKINKNKNIKNGIFDLMKNTPMVYIKSLSEFTGCNIYGKCEYYLPYTSKDRMIKNIILHAKE
jgi:cysteine synthase A